MKKVSIFLAQGFEEVEALTPADLFRRAGAEVTLVAIGDTLSVKGKSNITVLADKLFEDVDFSDMDLLILPGGVPGTDNLKACDKLRTLLYDFHKEGKKLAAICAAPTVLGSMGLLEGRKAVCYPGYEGELKGAQVLDERVAVDGNITTGRSAGAAMAFSLSLIGQLFGDGKAEEVSKSIVYGHN